MIGKKTEAEGMGVGEARWELLKDLVLGAMKHS